MVIYSPTLSSQAECQVLTEVERNLLLLPCQFGGLNILKLTCCSDFQFTSSKLFSASSVAIYMGMILQLTERTFTPFAFYRLVLPFVSPDSRH